MTVTSNPDRFEVINGPEDGTQFPVTRTPVDLGSDGQCLVHLRFDGKVDPVHARISVVEGGYRVRRCGRGAVLVDGRRTGRVRSRIVRHGGIVTVGGTELCLQLAGHGLASRSYGLTFESDSSWVVRSVWRQLQGALGGVLHAIFGFARRRPVLTIIVVAGIGGYLYLTRRGGGGLISYWIGWVLRWVQYLLSQGVNRVLDFMG